MSVVSQGAQVAAFGRLKLVVARIEKLGLQRLSSFWMGLSVFCYSWPNVTHVKFFRLEFKAGPRFLIKAPFFVFHKKLVKFTTRKNP